MEFYVAYSIQILKCLEYRVLCIVPDMFQFHVNEKWELYKK